MMNTMWEDQDLIIPLFNFVTTVVIVVVKVYQSSQEIHHRQMNDPLTTKEETSWLLDADEPPLPPRGGGRREEGINEWSCVLWVLLVLLDKLERFFSLWHQISVTCVIDVVAVVV